LKVPPAIFILIVFLLVGFAYIVFRVIVRRDYRLRGRLTPLTSTAQLIVFAELMSFPYLFNPPAWPWFWIQNDATKQQYLLGMVIVILGFTVAFGTMGWFGMRRAFGLETRGLIRTGPYRVTRNPQALGGYLLVIGITVQWFSWFAVIWVILYGLILHWMIITEEEHLQTVFGDEYKSYCGQTPRYLLNIGRLQKDSFNS